jgi:ribosomal protein S18 acetylase RimI-like enzyme
MEMDSAEILVLQASYSNPTHAEAIGIVLNHYAEDPMGGGHSLDPELLRRLPEELARRPHAFSVLAFVGGEPAGLVNCFEGFSTFACKPLVNVHDVAVVDKFRGLGLSQKMLQKVEEISRQRGCCKITLEVLEGNAVAQNAYSKFGFAPGMFDPDHGRMQFWIKSLQA